jgi:heme-degrading monooxygenase HmoA
VIVQLVRYGSRLTYDEVMERFEGRSDRYMAIPGLLQTYYVHYSETNEYGGVYIWESEEALQKWRDTNLRDTRRDLSGHRWTDVRSRRGDARPPRRQEPALTGGSGGRRAIP